MERIDHLLPWSTLGSEKRLSVFRFGCGARKVYIQSSLHADELPGMRTAWELKQRLRLLEAEGRLRGTVELVPVANPVGLGQMIQALHQGRFEMSSGRNFNRDFPDLLDAVIDSVGERLGSDPAANVALVRQALRAALDALPPRPRNWRACSACSIATPATPTWCSTCIATSRPPSISIPCRSNGPPSPPWPHAWRRRRAARRGVRRRFLRRGLLGAVAAPVAPVSARRAAAGLPGDHRRTRRPGRHHRAAGRGQRRGDPGLPRRAGLRRGRMAGGARSLLRRLALRGHRIRPRPAYRRGEFPARPGEWVEAGEPLFQVIDPLADRASTVCAGVSGVLFAIERMRYAQPGLWLAKVAGRQPIRQGRLLSD